MAGASCDRLISAEGDYFRTDLMWWTASAPGIAMCQSVAVDSHMRESRPWSMYGRPPRGKGQFNVSGRLVGCRHVFGLSSRPIHAAGPDVVRRSDPRQVNALSSGTH
jgi:hypothetical protein